MSHKIAIIADLHLNNNQYGKTVEGSGLLLKTDDALKAFKFTIDESIKRKVDHYVIAGDLFEHPSPTSKIRRLVNAELQRLIDNKILITALIGNHDLCNEHHALEPLVGWNKGLRVASDFGVERKEKATYVYVPHTFDIEKRKKSFKDYIAKLKDTVHPEPGHRIVMFGHFPVFGALQNDSVTNKNDRNVAIEELIDLDYDAIFLGDFHKRQKLSDSGQIYYVGSPEKVDFSERNQDKGFCIYDVVTNDIEWINYEGSRPLIEITGDNVDEIDLQIENLDLNNAIVKIKVTGSDEEFAYVQQRFNELSGKVSESGSVFFAGLERVQNEDDDEDDEDSESIKELHAGSINVFDIVQKNIESEDISDDEKDNRISILRQVEKEVASELQLSTDVSFKDKRTIKFKSVKLHNFCRFGEKDNVVDFDKLFEDANGSSMASISGIVDGNPSESNGSGKSTILESIAYVLYERMPRLSLFKDPSKSRDKSKKTTFEIIRTDDAGKFACKEAYAELTMEVSGSEWVIRRGRKVQKNDKHTAILELSKDGEPYNSRKSKDPNDVIKDLIGVDYEPFCNSVFFAQKDTSKLFTATPGVRIDTILNILGVLSDITSAIEKIRERKKTVAAEISTLSGRVDTLKEMSSHDEDTLASKISELVTETEEFDEKIKKNDKNTVKIRGLKDKKVARREEMNLSLKGLDDKIDSVDEKGSAESLSLKYEISSCEDQVKAINERDKRFSDDKEILRVEYENYLKIRDGIKEQDLEDSLEKISAAKLEKVGLSQSKFKCQEEIVTFAGKRAQYESDGLHAMQSLEKYKSVLNTVKGQDVKCPHCGSVHDRDHYDKEIDNLREKIRVSEREAAEVKGKNKESEKRLVGFVKTEEGLDFVIDRAPQVVSQLQKRKDAVIGLDAVGKKIVELKKRMAEPVSTDTFESLGERMKEAKSKLEGIQLKYHKMKEGWLKETTVLNSDIRAIKHDIVMIDDNVVISEQLSKTLMGRLSEAGIEKARWQDSLSTLRKLKKDLSKATESLEGHRNEQIGILYLESSFGSDGVKMDIVDYYLPIFNNHMENFITILTEGRINVSIDRETMEPVIFGASSSSYEMLSGGEQDVIRLAGNLALGMVSLGSSRSLPETLFLDEIFGALAPAMKERVFKLIDHLRSYFNRILVITHDLELQTKFSRGIYVHKNNGISAVSLLNDNH